MSRSILHVDMDAFFAAIEQRDHPELRGKPVIVGAGPHERGVVSTASYEARKFGIHSAMPSREAYRRCPNAIFVPGNHRLYMEISRQIFRIFGRYTPFVEGLSCDEAFLDVGGSRKLFGDSVTIAKRIRADIKSELSLTASVGVAHNKFLAKVASDMNKPDGLTVVPDDEEGVRLFLAPLSARRIFGVGQNTAAALEKAGIRTIGDIQMANRATLARVVGENGAAHIIELAFGRDDRPLELEREEKSISREYTFPEDERDEEKIMAVLLNLASDVARRVRKHGKYAAVGRLKLRWSDFTSISRQRPFDKPSCDDITFREMARSLYDSEKGTGRPVRLIGFGTMGFSTERATQMGLFADESDKLEKRENLSRALDDIRAKLDGGEISFGHDRND